MEVNQGWEGAVKLEETTAHVEGISPSDPVPPDGLLTSAPALTLRLPHSARAPLASPRWPPRQTHHHQPGIASLAWQSRSASGTPGWARLAGIRCPPFAGLQSLLFCRTRRSGPGRCAEPAQAWPPVSDLSAVRTAASWEEPGLDCGQARPLWRPRLFFISQVSSPPWHEVVRGASVCKLLALYKGCPWCVVFSLICSMFLSALSKGGPGAGLISSHSSPSRLLNKSRVSPPPPLNLSPPIPLMCSVCVNCLPHPEMHEPTYTSVLSLAPSSSEELGRLCCSQNGILQQGEIDGLKASHR